MLRNTLFFFFIMIFVPSISANELSNLYRQVKSLEINIQGYILGATLTAPQKKRLTPIRDGKTSPGTCRFKDNTLTIVTDCKTDQILIMYEHFEDASIKKIHETIGDLIITFGEPTVTAHNKTIYWSYGKGGKISSPAFRHAKKTKTHLDIIAGIKLQSELPVTGKTDINRKGSFYYIISSHTILNQLFSN